MTRTLAQRIGLCGLGLILVLGPLGVALAGPTEGGFHWARKPSQFTLQVGENLDGKWQTIFRRAVSEWNAGETVTFRAVNGSSNPQECRPTNGQVEVCNGRYGTQDGWLGLTRLYFDTRGEHIESATVQLNDSFFDQANGIYNSDAARQHTMCHELGHTPGLDHVDTSSCMNDSQEAVFQQEVPINKDFRELERIYQHQDDTTTVAGKPASDKDRDKRDKKGKKDRRDRTRDRDESRRSAHEGWLDRQAESVVVETRTDGRMVVSFITWAHDESAEAVTQNGPLRAP